MSKVIDRLNELLKKAGKIKNADRSAWAAETRRLIDVLLGPSPINLHSEGYWEFNNARSHEEKTAILRGILVSQDLSPSQFGSIVPNPDADVFLVHGHDMAARESVARFLENIGLKTVILSEKPSSNSTILEKIEKFSNVRFAVVLLTPDDIGGPTNNNDDKTMLPRARQNVILELGYFMGKLGRSNVCTLYKQGVELPSDYHGVVYIELDNADGWKMRLAKELKASGFKLDLNQVL
jgi:predicted nucleotide-binding protein